MVKSTINSPVKSPTPRALLSSAKTLWVETMRDPRLRLASALHGVREVCRREFVQIKLLNQKTFEKGVPSGNLT